MTECKPLMAGDHRAIAVETCRVLGLGTTVLGAEKLPLMKAEDLEKCTTLGRAEQMLPATSYNLI